MAYGCFKDLSRKIVSDIAVSNKALNIAKNLKSIGYERRLESMIYKLFDKKTNSGSGVQSEIISNQELAEELHQPIIKKIEKRKVH